MSTLRTSRITTRPNRPSLDATRRELDAIRRQLDSLRQREAELDAEYEADRAAFEAGTADQAAVLTRSVQRITEFDRLLIRRWHLLVRLEELGDA